MNTEIKAEIHAKISKLTLLIKDFFQTFEKDEDNNFKVDIDYEQLRLVIEASFNTELLPLSITVYASENTDEISFLTTEFDAFYNYIITAYYDKDFRLPYEVGINLTSKELAELGDSEKDWYNEVQPFLKQKKYLYEILRTYKRQINGVGIILHEDQSKPIEGRVVDPKTFNEIFKPGWEKYIRALIDIEPQILNEAMEFQLKKRGGNGIITSWIFALMDKKKFNPKFNLQQIIGVFNNEIKNIQLGSKGRNVYDFSVAYNKNYKSRLESLL